jgi:hypothetical protein
MDMMLSKKLKRMVSRITPEQAAKVGHQIWLNETGGVKENITSWNTGESFASLGIGHFIWFPTGQSARFEESFPEMLQFLRQEGAILPQWLNTHPTPPCPWKDRDDFNRNLGSAKMIELREFLHNTRGLQVKFLVRRMTESLPKILSAIGGAATRKLVARQFWRVVQSSGDLYPLIDYINFKGEGIVTSERFVDVESGIAEGWGLLQVLLEMRGTSIGESALSEFADAAQKVLKRRVRNNPADKVWEKGWLIRCDSYRRPLP